MNKLAEALYRAYGNLVHHIPGGYSLLPPLIIWNVTYKCNLRCKMCARYGEGGTREIDIKGELELNDFKNIIDDIKKSYRLLKPFIGITGGEPFMRKDIFDILAYLKGFRFSITTNFTALDEERIKRLARCRPKQIRISIDGPEKVHDRIRGVKGTFSKAMSNISILRKYADIPIRFNCAISKDNMEHLEDVVRVAKENKVKLNFQHLIFMRDIHLELHKNATKKFLGQELKTSATLCSFTEEEANRLIENVKKAKHLAEKLDVELSFLPELDYKEMKKYYGNPVYWASRKCTFPWNTARIDNFGNLLACMGYYYGNLRENKFKKAWNGLKARKFRKVLKKVGVFPGCLRCCKL
tara:strand:+ start:1408 stop:2469 length:1062 start_codon:yes stop_codon:yes gene_type:complete